MLINLSWNFGAGNMTLDLDALFTTCGVTKINKLMKFIRDMRTDNEESYNQTIEYIDEHLEFWYKAAVSAVRNYEANTHGSYAYQRYKREAINCEKEFKKYHKALNILTNVHTTLDNRIYIMKKRVD